MNSDKSAEKDDGRTNLSYDICISSAINFPISRYKSLGIPVMIRNTPLIYHLILHIGRYS